MTKVRLNTYIDCGDYYEIILTDRKGNETARAKIDKSDYDTIAVCRWSLNTRLRTTQGFINKKVVQMSTTLLGTKNGYVIDHINHDRLDNRRCNIRWATKSQNAMNMKGVLGVTWDKKRKKWMAQIMVNYKHIFLGYFDDFGDAINARHSGVRKYFGEFGNIELDLRA